MGKLFKVATAQGHVMPKIMYAAACSCSCTCCNPCWQQCCQQQSDALSPYWHSCDLGGSISPILSDIVLINQEDVQAILRAFIQRQQHH